MNGEGWRRLWELLKWLGAIAVGIFCANEVAQTLPVPTATSSPTAGQVLFGLLIAALIPGGIAFGFLSLLEWVYRGFRPLPPTLASEKPQIEATETEPLSNTERYPTLPSPDGINRLVTDAVQMRKNAD